MFHFVIGNVLRSSKFSIRTISMLSALYLKSKIESTVWKKKTGTIKEKKVSLPRNKTQFTDTEHMFQNTVGLYFVG